jgi:hypothetical protein
VIKVARKLKATDVIEALCDLFVMRGIPAHIRSDNGPEFVPEALLHIEGGSGRDRKLAASLQHRPTSPIAGISATST